MRVILAKTAPASKRKFIIGFLLLLLPIAFLTVAAFVIADFRAKATIATPQRMIVGNLSSNSAVISWATPGGKTLAAIEWGDSPSSLEKTEVDYRNKTSGKSESHEAHYVQLDNLQPNKEYYYRIKSGDTVYPGPGEEPYSLKTLPLKTHTATQTVSIYGQVEGDNANESIVIAYVSSAGSESLPLITYPKQDGSWYLNIGQATAKTLNQQMIVTEKNPVTLLFDGGLKGAILKSRAEEAPLAVKLSDNFAPEELYASLGGDTLVQTTPIQTVKPTLIITVTPAPSTSAITTVTPAVQPTPKANGPINFSALKQDVALNAVVPPSDPILGQKTDVQQENIQLSLYSTPTLTNITDTSLSLFWITKAKESTQLLYGSSQSTTSERVFDDRDGNGSPREYFIHHVTLTKLSSGTQYSYMPGKSGTSATFTMPPVLQAQPAFQNISGKVTGGSGECIMKTVLQKGTTKSSPISTLVTPDLQWILNIGPVRTTDLKSYFNAVATDQIIFDVVCVAGPDTFRAGSVTVSVDNALKDGVTITVK